MSDDLQTRPRGKLYDWDKLTDGQPHKLVRGEHYWSKTASFVTYARAQGKWRSKKLVVLDRSADHIIFWFHNEEDG